MKRSRNVRTRLQNCRRSSRNVYRGTATINDLPNETLEYIFCFLGFKSRLGTELVCRRWREISRTIGWRLPTGVDIGYFQKEHLYNIPLCDEMVSSLLIRCGKSLKKLELLIHGYNAPEVTSKVLNIISDNCPNLVELTLGLEGLPMNATTKRRLMNVAKKCTKLKKVFIGLAEHLDDKTVVPFVKQLPTVERFFLSFITAITDKYMEVLPKTLKGFYVNECGGMNFNFVVEKLLGRFGHIEELGLIDLTSISVTLLLKVLCHYQNTLKTLYLDNYEMKSCDWYRIPDAIQNIEVLSVSGADGINNNFLKKLAEKCSKLQALNLRYLTEQVNDNGISALACAPSLRILDATCVWIQGPGLRTLGMQGRLERVYFDSIYCDQQIMEDSCISLANNCPHLRYFDLRNNYGITNRLVHEFNSSLERGYLKGPVTLYVKHTKVTKDVECCKKLRLSFWNNIPSEFCGTFM